MFQWVIFGSKGLSAHRRGMSQLIAHLAGLCSDNRHIKTFHCCLGFGNSGKYVSNITGGAASNRTPSTSGESPQPGDNICLTNIKVVLALCFISVYSANLCYALLLTLPSRHNVTTWPQLSFLGQNFVGLVSWVCTAGPKC